MRAVIIEQEHGYDVGNVISVAPLSPRSKTSRRCYQIVLVKLNSVTSRLSVHTSNCLLSFPFVLLRFPLVFHFLVLCLTFSNVLFFSLILFPLYIIHHRFSLIAVSELPRFILLELSSKIWHFFFFCAIFLEISSILYLLRILYFDVI